MQRDVCRTAMVCVLASWLSIYGLLAPASAEEPLAAMPDFRLNDAAGKELGLGDFDEADLVVVAFVGTECPLVRLYAPRLARLAAEYGPRGVQFVGIDANVQDSAEKVADFVERHELDFPVLLDPDAAVADAFGAQRTPEVFVLDRSRHVRYRGRIDDQFSVGIQRPEVGRHDLARAIDELLAGRQVSEPVLEATGCLIGRPKQPDAESSVTWSDQIAALVSQHCVECHRPGEIGPFSLTSYDDAAAWGEALIEAVDAGRMPPWFADPAHGKFANEHRLDEAEKDLLTHWVEAGCPEGDRQGVTANVPAAAGDAIARREADLIIPMSEQPFHVPADGVVDYQYYVVDPGWTEDQWIADVEVRPGNRSVVHHILVFVQRPGSIHPPVYPGELIGGYVPGLRGIHYPENMAMRLPAGSRIVFQMHYTPNGVAGDDLSSVALRMADPAEVTHEVRAEKAINILFQIPPHAADYEAQSTYTFVSDALLLSLIPHMHVRGKSFRYEAIYPDGTRETLLSVPHYDFNWQLEYILDEPKPIPAGTRLVCSATYDNSSDNPANPDPARWVTFGEQTWQEMLIGFFVIAEDRDLDRSPQLADRLRTTADLVDDLDDPGSWTDRLLRIAEETDRRTRLAQRQGRLENKPILQEIGHVLWAGVAEAKKQQVLRDDPPVIDIRRGLPFLERMGRALSATLNENEDSAQPESK